jgi:peptide/nickel transport system permease protein
VAGVILRRVALAIPMLFGMSIVVFAVLRLVPGDPARATLGITASAASIREFRIQQHLNDSLPSQYLHWIGGVLHGNFGLDFSSSEPIGKLLVERLPVTVELALAALIIGVVVAVPLGVLAALRRGGPIDAGSQGISLLGICVPDFVIGILLILVVSVNLGWLPSTGWIPLSQSVSGNLQHIVLPAVSLAAGLIGVLVRITRNAVLNVLYAPFVRALRAKGIRERRIIARHVVRNAALPIVTVLGMQAGYLLGGTLIVEQVFSLPGLGSLTVTGVLGNDYPAVQAAILVIATMYVLVNLATDITYLALNPRLRTGEAS